MSEVFLGDCRVVENRRLADRIFLLRLEAPAIAKAGIPGQFVMVRTGPAPQEGGPLLKRPFSIHRLGPGDEIALLVQVVGVGTGLLSRAAAGEALEVLGPLGRGFVRPDSLPRAYLVAGGIGAAPMLALAEAMDGETELTLFYGARTEEELLSAYHRDFFGSRLVLCTEDGSEGLPGLVTAPLAAALEREPAPVFACGPRPMLAEAAAAAVRAGVPAQVSLEAHMACGLGVCLGCAVETISPGYARVCVEGPVFPAEEVKW